MSGELSSNGCKDLARDCIVCGEETGVDLGTCDILVGLLDKVDVGDPVLDVGGTSEGDHDLVRVLVVGHITGGAMENV